MFSARTLERFDGGIGGEADGHGALGVEGECGAGGGRRLHGPLPRVWHSHPRRETDGHHLPDRVLR